MFTTRRRFLKGAGGLIAAGLLPAAAGASLLTPRQPAGPFYPLELPLDDDNDLVHVQGQSQAARGELSDLRGRVLDRNGRPLKGARVEIWQCDANGRYRHPRDRGRASIDPGFQGFGHSRTDGDGAYRFLTIRPVPYTGRTPHIHVAVHVPGEKTLVTQLYVAGDPGNAEDFLYRRIPPDQRERVSAAFAEADGDVAHWRANWDIALDLPSQA